MALVSGKFATSYVSIRSGSLALCSFRAGLILTFLQICPLLLPLLSPLPPLLPLRPRFLAQVNLRASSQILLRLKVR